MCVEYCLPIEQNINTEVTACKMWLQGIYQSCCKTAFDRTSKIFHPNRF